AGGDGRGEGAEGALGPQDRRVWRARRRPVVDPLLPHRGARLRVLLALPRADRAAGGGPGPAREAGRRLATSERINAEIAEVRRGAEDEEGRPSMKRLTGLRSHAFLGVLCMAEAQQWI